MNCATCKFWNTEQKIGESAEGWGVCEKAFSNDGKPKTPDTLAYGCDMYDYGAGLVTHTTFGCVMYQAKE